MSVPGTVAYTTSVQNTAYGTCRTIGCTLAATTCLASAAAPPPARAPSFAAARVWCRNISRGH
eukprot:644407-Rhodomonas_salina.1